MKTILIICIIIPLWQLHARSESQDKLRFHTDGFVQNKGQVIDQDGNVNHKVSFIYTNGDFHLALTPSGFSYELLHETVNINAFPESGFTDPDEYQEWKDAQISRVSSCRIDVSLKGADMHPEIRPDNGTGTVLNYYTSGNIITNVPSFNRITYKNIYPHIDLVFEIHSSENGSYPEYSFIVHPGGDARRIMMSYSGLSAIKLENPFNLDIYTSNRFIKETGLNGYWLEDPSPAAVSFRLKNHTLSFNAPHSNTKTLIIDPVIVWGSFFGGKSSENWDTESEIALSNENKVILTGSTQSSSYVATNGAFMQTYGGNRDMLLAKFSLDGTQIEWATYFGGNGQDVAYGVCCNAEDNILITGFAKSQNIPTSIPNTFLALQGTSDVVIAKFSSSGMLIWDTLLGGINDAQPENGRSLICDANMNIYLCGFVTSDNNVATEGAYQPGYAGSGDAFLAKYDKNGTKIWCTYFSGIGQDRAHALCLDPFGNVYFVGTAKSKKNFISNGLQTKFGGLNDAFLAKFDTSGKYFWSTYYGGTGGEHGRGVKCDGLGNIYFTGWTNSTEPNVISTSGSYQQNLGGSQDGFLAKFTPDGRRLWGTYFGGISIDLFFGLTIDSQANLYLSGGTKSENNIATTDALQDTIGGGQDVMIVKFDSSGYRMWSSYLGDSVDDNSYDIEIDSFGMIYLDVNSVGPLPVSSNAWQTFARGKDDLAVFKIDINTNPPPPRINSAVYNILSSKILIGPNPASDYIQISNFNSEEGKAEVIIHDVNGRILLDKQLLISEENPFINIPVNQIPEGLYIIAVKQNEFVISRKILISRKQ
ncbi:MAG: T9SS type A sorting domain-containing protein [Chitinophagales bacterium]|nr:T9SS type A sorting domain-containing protein [Chitinophagales bacterium]